MQMHKRPGQHAGPFAFAPSSTSRPELSNSCYYGQMPTAGTKRGAVDLSSELPLRLSEALQRERLIPRFVDSYVVEHGRYGLQVHAALYRDLLTLLQREALLAITVQALEIAAAGPSMGPKGKRKPMTRKDATLFRRKFLTALGRQQKWTAGDALDFQRDLQMYEELIARGATPRRRKPFEAANHPFVDRCAFLLDSPFLEKARVAASRALTELEGLSAKVTQSVLQGRPA